MGSRRQYQRVLHESYQFLVKYVTDQQVAESNYRKGVLLLQQQQPQVRSRK